MPNIDFSCVGGCYACTHTNYTWQNTLMYGPIHNIAHSNDVGVSCMLDVYHQRIHIMWEVDALGFKISTWHDDETYLEGLLLFWSPFRIAFFLDASFYFL